jgi:hypothetical protein
MTDVRSLVQVVLQNAGYRTWLADIERMAVACFEDDAVMGFASVFDDAAQLLQRWKAVEMAFLTRYADDMRQAGEKAWNVYSIFLSSGSADSVQAREIRWIEEDLERTRKLAASGVVGRDGLVTALLPIMPLQYRPRLDVEDATQRLRRRIASIAPAAVDAALNDAVPPAEVLRLLRTSK